MKFSGGGNLVLVPIKIIVIIVTTYILHSKDFNTNYLYYSYIHTDKIFFTIVPEFKIQQMQNSE